jgi:hypothetical protein
MNNSITLNQSTTRTAKRRAKDTRPKRPTKGIWLHSNGSYCSKINGLFHYFGRDPDEAVALYVREKPYLKQGEAPPDDGGGNATVDALLNLFLAKMDRDRQSGELGDRMFQSYMDAARDVKKVFGADRRVDDLRPTDVG